MSKIIAVWGCPDSGKTTFCAKLTRAIYDVHPTKIISILTDPVTPDLPMLFPNKKAAELYSVGEVMSETDITQETLLKSLVTVSEAREVGFLGFNNSENLRTYPEFSREKAELLLDAAAALADFVIVDCGGNLSFPIPFAAISKAAVIFRMCKPDLKAVSFFASQSPLYADLKYRMDEQIPVMTVNEQDLYIPAEEAGQHFKCGKLVIPYAKEIRQQSADGCILGKTGDKAFNNAMIKIMKAVVEHGEAY